MTPGTDRPLRIALLNSADYAGGAETVARMLTDGLHERGHDSVLWVGRRRANAESDRTRGIPCTTARRQVAQRYARKGFFNLGLESSVGFCTSAALADVDIVHLHNLHGHYFSMTALPTLVKRGPLVWTFHDFFPLTGGCAFPFECQRWLSTCGSCPQLGEYPLVTPYDRTRRLQAIKRRTFSNLPVTIVTPSHHLMRAVIQSGVFTAADMHTIPYGVDTQMFRPDRARARQRLGLSPDRPVALLIAQGLNDPRKGVQYAVSALRQVDVPGLIVLLVGAGDVQPIVEALPNREVRGIGYVAAQDALSTYYTAADLFIFTSLAENFPCVVLEAMSAGTPVLAFDIPGTAEQITPHRTGFLVPPGQTDELARVATELLRETEKLASIGLAARAQVEADWTRERFLDRHERLYRTVLADRTLAFANQVAYSHAASDRAS
jgi:glycosyltransferase involved in cell wall biosynthesis